MATQKLAATLLVCWLLPAGIVGSSCSRRVKPAEPDKSAGPKSSLVVRATQADAMALMSRIREGMTFAEVAQLVPLSERDLVSVTHGGAQFVLRLGDYMLRLRFDRPQIPPGHLPTQEDMKDCLLNRPPELLPTQPPSRQRDNGMRHGSR